MSTTDDPSTPPEESQPIEPIASTGDDVGESATAGTGESMRDGQPPPSTRAPLPPPYTPPPPYSPPPTTSPYPPPPGTTRQRNWASGLHRSSSDRLIAGVAGGLAESTGVPPLIIRLLFVVSATFVVGLVIYLVAWAVLPTDSDVRVGEPDHVLGRLLVAAGVALAVIILPLGGVLTTGMSRLAIPAMLVLVGLAMINRNHGSPTGTGADTSGRPMTGTDPRQPGDEPLGAPTMSPPGPVSGATEVDNPLLGRSTKSGGHGRDTGAVPPMAPPTGIQTAIQPMPEPRRQRPSLRFPYVGLLTWSIVLVVLGAVAATAVLGGPVINPGAATAFALILFSAGLIFSAFRGRARGLILPILGLVALLGTLAVVDVRVDAVERPFELTANSADELPDELHSTAGTSELQLTGLQLNEDRTVHVRVDFGTLRVDLPRETTVVVTGHVGLGNKYSYTYNRPATAMNTDIQKQWIKDGVPAAGSPIDPDLLTNQPGLGYSIDSFGTRFGTLRTEDDFGGGGLAVGLDTMFDRGSEHILTLDVEVGVGAVELIEPFWSSDPWDPVEATQLCTNADGPAGTVMPCGDLAEALRVPLCINDNAYLVDCRMDRPATPDSPRIAACLDMLNEEVDCASLGIDPVGAQLIGPTEKVTRGIANDDETSEPDTLPPDETDAGTDDSTTSDSIDPEAPASPDGDVWTTEPATEGDN